MYEYGIKEIVKVVDGDTIVAVLDLGFGIFKTERMRLEGIDTPESITKDKEEKALGMEAKQYLKDWLKGQSALRVKTSKDDKYGRTLGIVYGDGPVSINEEMIAKGYAWEYQGETKVKDFSLLKEKRNA